MNMLGAYIPSDSFVHRLDGTIRLISFIALFAAIAISEGVIGYLLSLLSIVIIYRMGKLSVIRTLKMLRRFNAFFITVFLMNAFFQPSSEPIFSFSFIVFSSRGVLLGLDMVLRVVFAVLLSAALTSSSTPVSITDGLRTILHPLSYLRIPVDEAASAISIAITLIPLISSESREIILASSARGIRVETEGKLKAKAHSLAPLVIPLFLAAFRKAENLGMAMEARGYSSGMRKSRRKNSVRIGRSEILFLILSFSIFISSLIIKEVL